eukprot:5098976-Prorocentrum_lima.AAC.1
MGPPSVGSCIVSGSASQCQLLGRRLLSGGSCRGVVCPAFLLLPLSLPVLLPPPASSPPSSPPA